MRPRCSRREFGDERGGDRQFGAQTEADHEACRQEREQRPRECHGTVGESEHDHCGGEHRLAAELVGEETAQRGADGHANEADRQHP